MHAHAADREGRGVCATQQFKSAIKKRGHSGHSSFFINLGKATARIMPVRNLTLLAWSSNALKSAGRRFGDDADISGVFREPFEWNA